MKEGAVKNRHRLLKNTWENRGLLIMALPALALIFMFNYMPMAGLVVAFKNYNFMDGIWNSDWVGLRNFSFLFVSKELTVRIVRNTVLYWLLFTAVGTVCSVALAIMINQCSNAILGKLSQTVMIFPTFISWIAVSFVVKAVLDGENGMLNRFIESLGGEAVQWYAESSKWPVILLIVNLWKSAGYNSVIYLSALSGMDASLFEAADLDGASKWQQIRYITLPMLTSMVCINILLGLGGIMHSNTGLFYQVTRNIGLLYPTTQTIDSYVMATLTSGSNEFGLTSAITFFQSIIGCILVILTNWFVRSKEEENALF